MTNQPSIKADELPQINTATEFISNRTCRELPFEIEGAYTLLKGEQPLERHVSASDVIVFCVVGAVDIEIAGQRHQLSSNQMTFIAAGSTYQFEAQQPSAIVTAKLSPKPGNHAPSGRHQTSGSHSSEDVQEASEESFPASDSPSFNPSAT